MKLSAIFILTFLLSLPSFAAIDYGLDDTEIVHFPTEKMAGSIIIMTKEKRLYYILENDLAYVFPIAVGKKKKDRFYGAYPISRKAKWPSWRPTKNMLRKEPNLPEVIQGGKNNPLGARALYLGDSSFRIHGTNRPSSIGKAASHGCIRMHNKDVKKLYGIVKLWDMVYVKR